MNILEEPLFSFIAKSYTQDDGERILEGIATSNKTDDDGESIDQEGADISRFNWVTWGHGRSAKNTIGDIIEKRKTPKGIFVKIKLYKGFGPADEVWDLVQALKKNNSSNKLGFSVEGKVIERQGKKIAKCFLDRVSLDLTGINSDAIADIAKSFGANRLINLIDIQEVSETKEKINKSLKDFLKNEESNLKNHIILDLNKLLKGQPSNTKMEENKEFDTAAIETLAKSLFNEMKADEAAKEAKNDTLLKGMEDMFKSYTDTLSKSFDSKLEEITKSYEGKITEKETEISELSAKVEELAKVKNPVKGIVKSYSERFTTEGHTGKTLDVAANKKEILATIFEKVAKSTNAEDANKLNAMATEYLVTGRLSEGAVSLLSEQGIRLTETA